MRYRFSLSMPSCNAHFEYLYSQLLQAASPIKVEGIEVYLLEEETLLLEIVIRTHRLI
jgi:hypothetical protein